MTAHSTRFAAGEVEEQLEWDGKASKVVGSNLKSNERH
jgi:hypothetical protein